MNYLDYSYGVSEQFKTEDEIDEKVLELIINGYTTVESGLSEKELNNLKVQLDKYYIIQANETGGHEQLVLWGDANTLRAPIAYHESFLAAATTTALMKMASRYLGNEFILMMQNGLINKPNSGNQQGKYHRDLNYQHWTSSKPLALNALLCLDDFTYENGATWVTPGSHKIPEFPSEKFLDKFSIQITAKAGTYLILDAMLFHKAGINQTPNERRALNHVIGLPFMAQVIDIPKAMTLNNLRLPEDTRIKRYLGAQWAPVESGSQWRAKKFSGS